MANAHFPPQISLPFNMQNQSIINQEQQNRVPQGGHLRENQYLEFDIDIYTMSEPLFSDCMDFPESIQDFASQNLFDDINTLNYPLSNDPTTWHLETPLYPTPTDTYMLPESLHGMPGVSALDYYHPLPDIDVPHIPPNIDFPLWEALGENSSSLDISPEGSNISDSPYSYFESSISSTPPSTVSSSPPANVAYQCPDCRKLFTQRHLYNRHVKIHTKPYLCPEPGCGSQNATARDIQRHVNAHHPESPHAKKAAKPVCPYKGCRHATSGFARQDHLKRHLKQIHGH
ncbi:hypothetical protein F5884DRAFT_380224 [Xylogone sp. PMI_703]|nr:hypothetical protein F5884DRAFT_380224 [Xylogone sp. PMI_703]